MAKKKASNFLQNTNTIAVRFKFVFVYCILNWKQQIKLTLLMQRIYCTFTQKTRVLMTGNKAKTNYD